MNDIKVLVIGSSGMLGYAAFRYLQDQGYQVIGITKTKSLPNMLRMDAADERVIGAFLEHESFDVIINCAALLMKPSEERKCEAIKLNSWLPNYLSAYCNENRRYLIQVSTDAVFSGLGGYYQEDSPSDADTFYGKSKRLGEICTDWALTVRSGFWGIDVNPNGAGLLQWFLRQSGRVSGYGKAFFNGISNLEFARFVDAAIQNRWTGIYHLCAEEAISKYEFLSLAKRVFSREVEIVWNETVQIDRTLKSTRTDIPYRPKTFEKMLEDLKQWREIQGYPAI